MKTKYNPTPEGQRVFIGLKLLETGRSVNNVSNLLDLDKNLLAKAVEIAEYAPEKLESIRKGRSTVPAAWADLQERIKTSKVYFVTTEERSFIRIGNSYTGQEHMRRSHLQQGNPKPLLLLGAIKGLRKQEQDLHKRFAQYKAEGEWFTFSDEIKRYLKIIKIKYD
jgi:hypothetical protein